MDAGKKGTRTRIETKFLCAYQKAHKLILDLTPQLSDASTEQIAKVTPAAQEAFLTQLFEVGFFHADPHP